MINIRKLLQKICKKKPSYKSYSEMPDALIFLFFVMSALPTAYWMFVVNKVFEPYAIAVNATGFNMAGVVATIIMLGLALQVWFFGCIAKRTGGLLYDRWFL